MNLKLKTRKRKICVVTSSRADYSHLYPLIKEINKSDILELQLVVTGMHLLKKYGLTINEIKNDGFKISAKIKINQNKSDKKSIIKSMGTQMINSYDVFAKIKPDIIIVLGDRYDIHPVVTSSQILNIPVAHFHGGEVTTGSVDNNFRNSITKMSHLHFTADCMFKNRVIKMGENPKNVFNVGSLGNLGITKKDLMKKDKIIEYFKFKKNKYILVSIHPETINSNNKVLINNIIKSISKIRDSNIIFTSPNSDLESDYILKKITSFVKNNPDSRFIKSAGRNLYLSILKNAYCVIGNSSSCLIEAPYLYTPSILVGNRQNGRPVSSNIILANYSCISINKALAKLANKNFIKNIKSNIKYLPKNSIKKIINVLYKTDISKILQKKF